MALVRGEDDESDTEESKKPPLARPREREGGKGKLVDGEESETDDEDAYHDPQVVHTEANIRVKGTNALTSSLERMRERAKPSPGDGKLPETPQQKRLGEANRKLRKDLTTSILSTYQRAIHKADQVGDQLGKSQQITANCLDDLKHTTIYIDRLSDLLSCELTELPQMRTNTL